MESVVITMKGRKELVCSKCGKHYFNYELEECPDCKEKLETKFVKRGDDENANR